MKYLRWLLLLLTLPLWSQNTPTIGNLPDNGPTLPATCTVSQIYFQTQSTVGLFICTATNTWTQVGTGGGSGTVTSFSAGNLSPLFTSSVATPTTTPALTFSLSNAAAGSVFSNNTASAAGPAFNQTLTLGLNGGTGGAITLNGSTSGSATINVTPTGVFALPSGTTATNMALTTPALGTPSSGTLTNATGLPENSLVGAAGTATLTEGAAGDYILRSGIETNALTAPQVFVNSNSTNNNTSAAAIFSAEGTGTGGNAALFNTSGTGATCIMQGVQGGTRTNNALSGGSQVYCLQAGGTLVINASGPSVQFAGSGTALITYAAGGSNLNMNTAATSTGNISGAINITTGNYTGTTASKGTGALTVQPGSVTNSGAPSTDTVGALNLLGGAATTATNLSGGDVIVAGGLGTGSSAPGHVKLQGPTMLASGTTAQTEVTFFTRHVKAGSTTSGTQTTLFNIANPSNTGWGLEIVVHIDLISSTPNACSYTQRFYLSGENNNGTIGTVNIVNGTNSTLCSAGSITANLGIAATAANPSVISVTPAWTTITSITSQTITVIIENPSQQDITLL